MPADRYLAAEIWCTDTVAEPRAVRPSTPKRSARAVLGIARLHDDGMLGSKARVSTADTPLIESWSQSAHRGLLDQQRETIDELGGSPLVSHAALCSQRSMPTMLGMFVHTEFEIFH